MGKYLCKHNHTLKWCFTGQQDYSIAIGYQAGYTGHGTGSIAIGYQAGFQDSIGPNSVAIGTQAGQFGIGSNTVAIGYLAGPTGSNYNNNIILNASGSGLSPNTGSAFYTAPIRNATSGGTQQADISNTLFYNPNTYEITYAPSTANTLAWTAYTPTLDSSGTTNFGTGGSITGTYKAIGKTIFFNIRMVIGTSPSFGTGVFKISLPVAAINSNTVVASATYLDNGNGWYFGVANGEYSGSASTVTQPRQPRSMQHTPLHGATSILSPLMAPISLSKHNLNQSYKLSLVSCHPIPL